MDHVSKSKWFISSAIICQLAVFKKWQFLLDPVTRPFQEVVNIPKLLLTKSSINCGKGADKIGMLFG